MGLFDEFTEQQETTDRSDPKQIRDILPVEEWINSEYHVGSVADSLYDFWRPKIIEFIEGDYDEGIFTGGKRSGKTFSAIVLLTRKLYVLSCYEYPQRLFNLNDTTSISLAYFSANQTLAKDTGWNEWQGIIEGAPYFQNDYKKDPRLETLMDWPRDRGYNEVYCTFGSSENRTRGSALIAHIIDEAGFFKMGGGRAGSEIQQVRSIHNDSIERRKQQFVHDGEDPGFSIVISSATHAASYVEERRREAGEGGMYIQAVKYKVFPDNFSDEKLCVFVGSDKHEPQLIENASRIKTIIRDIDGIEVEGSTVDDVMEKLPAHLQPLFERPPIDFREDFERDITASIRGICGRPIGGTGSFFSNQEVFDACVASNLPYPFTQEDFVVSTESVEPIDAFFQPEKVCNIDDDYSEPKRNPNQTRYLYVDLSSQHDYTGISMCHIAGVERDETTGMESPIIEFDFLLRIAPPQPPARLDHSKVMAFIFHLRNKYNFPIKHIAFDQYQSEAKIQSLNKNLLTKDDEEAALLSVDRNDSKWLDFLSLLYNNNIRMHRSAALEEELFNLEHDRSRKKVDHPSGGYNDLSCSAVGAVALALEKEERVVEPANLDDYEEKEKKAIKTSEDLKQIWEIEGADGEAINPYQSEEDAMRDSFEDDIFDAMN